MVRLGILVRWQLRAVETVTCGWIGSLRRNSSGN